MDLKTKLKALETMSEEQFVIQNFDELIHHMLIQIGSTDPELRDNLIYSTFVKLINGNYLNKQLLQHITETCLDHQHLFYQLGERNSDAVFTRSFSSLVIAAILGKDKDAELLSSDVCLRAFASSYTYLRQENDTRGYVEGKGWAHSIAHGADLLVSAVEHPSYQSESSKEFLVTVQSCLFKGTVYTDNEDERLIYVIESLIDKEMQENELEEWIINLFNELEVLFENDRYSLNFYRIKTNVLNFIKSLYFRLGYKNCCHNTRNMIIQNLEIWHKKLY